MTLVINILIDILNEGLMYALLAMGMYITYSILDFPDLSVDGTFPLGAVLSGVLIIQGVDPWLCLVISFAAGLATLILPDDYEIPDDFKCVGELNRTEGKE